MKGWEKARGCKIEHQVAVEYGKEVLYCNQESKNMSKVLCFRSNNIDRIVDDMNNQFYSYRITNISTEFIGGVFFVWVVYENCQEIICLY